MNKKRYSILVLISLFCLILFPNISTAIETYDTVTPQIHADFDESVTIMFYSLSNLDTGKDYALTNESLAGMPKENYYFSPIKSLQNGMYEFFVQARDMVGNMGTYTWNFDVFVDPSSVSLYKPRLGFANSSIFDIKVITGMNSACKYSSIIPTDFDSLLLSAFDLTALIFSSPATYESDHYIYNHSITPALSSPFYVYCKDNIGRENLRDFTLHVDTTPPSFASKKATPNPVVEYPPSGPLTTELQVVTNEPTVCKYSEDNNATFQDMLEFDNFMNAQGQPFSQELLDAFQTENKVTILFENQSIIKKDFKYYVICEDRPGWKTSKQIIDVKVDLTAALSIGILYPPKFIKDTSMYFNLTTNKRAYCMYKTGDSTYPQGTMSSNPTSLSREHYANIGTLNSGFYTYQFRCIVPQAGDVPLQDSEKSFTFTIDTTPPLAPTINTSEFVCGDTLDASFWSNDSHSGIDHFVWSVGSQGIIYNNGTSDSAVSVSHYLNGSTFVLNSNADYFFKAFAVDGAGNIGPESTSSAIKFDDTGMQCDSTPPTILVDKSVFGDSVIINCYDNESGCGIINYGIALNQNCSTSSIGFSPITLPLTGPITVCWDVADLKGNVNKGQKTIPFNLSGSSLEFCTDGVDNDGDSRGDSCPAGPDCDDTDPTIYDGCESGCTQDTDGDGFGYGCNQGNDCNDHNTNLTVSCPNGCIIDNDGDEYGLGCSKGHDCNGLKHFKTIYCTNGCVSDNDADSYGFGCGPGLDCNGEDKNFLTMCTNDCVSDIDGDGFGIGCTQGFDCDGNDPNKNQLGTCDNGCVNDEDGDGFGFGCTKGNDCDNVNQLYADSCSSGCIIDHDGDGYGWGEFNSGCAPDCDDTIYETNLDCTATTNCVIDLDGDGFGLGCSSGPDCNDLNKIADNTQCTSNCSFDSDCDAMPDGWESNYQLDPQSNDANSDPDEDGIINIDEYRQNSDPNKATLKPIDDKKEFNPDEDNDNILDECELLYPSVLSNKDPYDYDKDPDGDGLENWEECGHIKGLCSKGTNPTLKDTDYDGYDDNEEILALTDPCDPESKPSSSALALILILLGLLMILASIATIVYRKYYLVLVNPAPAQSPSRAQQTQKPLFKKSTAKHNYNLAHHPNHLHQKHSPKPGPKLSRDKYMEEVKKRSEGRKKFLDVFGNRKKVEHSELMKKIALKHKLDDEKKKTSTNIRLKPESKIPAKNLKSDAVEKLEEKNIEPEHIEKLSKVIEDQAFSKLTSLTKSQVDEFGKLATLITDRSDKKQKLGEKQVEKLATITKKIKDDKEKKKEFKKAVEVSNFDKLDRLLSSKQHIDTFLKKAEEKEDAFEDLKKIGVPQNVEKSALKKLESLDQNASKEELFKTFKDISKDKHVDKNVFEILLSYLMKSGKINKHEVSSLLFDLKSDGVLDEKDVSDVFFNLGIKK
ncbi:hypothetical protein HOK51_10165 [Candidatus Woesearchaeota archaeon]|mgnify:CR=1 FL=1|jgi:hypothetical protein|nr:hypothetical protein [Candidatus Woesearchaeota archaeon]MBT7367185.1 hypothetical protein [Candidatus Woesearchaeota archaeon]